MSKPAMLLALLCPLAKLAAARIVAPWEGNMSH
jgi:hypothetical protein